MATRVVLVIVWLATAQARQSGWVLLQRFVDRPRGSAVHENAQKRGAETPVEASDATPGSCQRACRIP
eukprot:CAMPEP_0119200598 /NCGR_PEP_ID=MMETSP1316-20130426/26551_1 /TAXON_ID=41880 /ORGANISM="Pycnococcus provasolii, Strain RCC2336" /LENGTH=67 /DNA_ID=CAMNT_0007196665 /DNA_START=320 /DNA_END=523 /DNA_ORIENTATION=-